MKNLFILILLAFTINMSAQTVVTTADISNGTVTSAMLTPKKMLTTFTGTISAKQIKAGGVFQYTYASTDIFISYKAKAKKYEIEIEGMPSNFVVRTISEAKAIIKEHLTLKYISQPIK